MNFSQRLKVVEEYRKWIVEARVNEGLPITEDFLENFLAFLETKGYRFADEVRKETEKRIYQRLYDLCTKDNPFGAYDLLKEDVLGWAKEDGIEIEEYKTVDFEDIEQSDVIELPCKLPYLDAYGRKKYLVIYRSDDGGIDWSNGNIEPEADAFLADLKGGKRE